MPNYKLYYFPLRARAEPTRLLLTYAGAQFDDVLISPDQWPPMKEKMPMGQMPVLEVDGEKLCQSTAIARYIAREYGLAGNSSWEMARADMLVDGIFDMWGHLRDVYIPKLQGDEKTAEENWKKFQKDHLIPFLDRFEKLLLANKSGWFVGKSITWADIVIAEFFSVLQDCFYSDAIDSHPNLNNFVNKVLELPQLKTYVANRNKTPF